MRLGSVKIYTTTSNSTIALSYSNPLVLYNIKILAINPKMNLTITITNANGDSWSFTITSGTEITFKKVNYQSIAFKDVNNYTIYYSLQAIYTDSYKELLELEQESDINIVPINNVIITSPIDSAGNVMVDVENYPLDSSGNVKTSIQNTPNVGVTSPLDASGNVKTAVENFPLDASGNIKVNVESPLDASGNVKTSVQNTPNVSVTSPLDASGNVKTSVQNFPLDSSGNLKVDIENEAVASIGINAFSNALATANTKQALAPPTGYPTVAQAFIIIINLSPSDTIYIGDANNQIIPLAPNQSIAFDVHKFQILLNVTSIYWVGATASTDKVGVIYA